ncbi:adenylyl-sulfate kinase [Nocardia sp. NPDC050630]|uniref:adenylyl-sulfate kinase n=1 Tax=Nocardia sp. NPDC050630 TaxID=3364321 RepID=UPI0037BD1F17
MCAFILADRFTPDPVAAGVQRRANDIHCRSSPRPKGLYAKARRGELLNFTGIDSP